MEFSLISWFLFPFPDDETEAHIEQEQNHDNIGSESKKSMVGTKRPIQSEPFAYHTRWHCFLHGYEGNFTEQLLDAGRLYCLGWAMPMKPTPHKTCSKLYQQFLYMTPQTFAHISHSSIWKSKLAVNVSSCILHIQYYIMNMGYLNALCLELILL